MNNNDINIFVNYSEYKALFNSKTKQIAISVNLENIVLPKSLISAFIESETYFSFLKEALKKRLNINFILMQDEVLLLKNTFSPISLVLGIKNSAIDMSNEFKREFLVLLNRTDFRNYSNKNRNKIYEIEIEGSKREISYEKLFTVILDDNIFHEFIGSKSKYHDFNKEEFVFALQKLIISQKLFLVLHFDTQTISFYKSLFEIFDVEAINKYLTSEFKYTNNFEINKSLSDKLFSSIPRRISLLEKTIYLYLEMFLLLKYDFEITPDSNNVKKHKDFARISEIDVDNNRVFTYEFSCLLAKIFESLKINFEYNDKYIIARIDKYFLKYKSITSDFNSEFLSQVDLLKGITLLNSNINTKKEFSKLMNKIYNNIYHQSVNFEIMRLPFNQLLSYYKLNSRKNSLNFNLKYEIFMEAINSVPFEANAMGYIFALKKIIFNDDELGSNISFTTIAECENKGINPVVIVTVNMVNINLYNSNKYIYYNPPKPIKTYNLNEIRQEFFYGRFKYVEGRKDNIIGVEKSNI